MSKLAFRAQTVDIAYLPLRQGFFGKKRFNDLSKEFPFGQQPGKRGPEMSLPRPLYTQFFHSRFQRSWLQAQKQGSALFATDTPSGTFQHFDDVSPF